MDVAGTLLSKVCVASGQRGPEVQVNLRSCDSPVFCPMLALIMKAENGGRSSLSLRRVHTHTQTHMYTCIVYVDICMWVDMSVLQHMCGS